MLLKNGMNLKAHQHMNMLKPKQNHGRLQHQQRKLTKKQRFLLKLYLI